MATGDSPIPMTVSVDRPWNARRIELPEATWLALASSTHLRSVEAAGAVVDGTTSGPAFVRRLHETRPGLALVVSPPAGTTELLAAIRERRQRATLRIVYLNESSAIEPRLEALALGFDDALPITIEPRELIGRIRLMLGGGRAPLVEPRRSTVAPGIELDFAARRALRDGSDVHLRPKEFALLASLASDPGRVFTREEMSGPSTCTSGGCGRNWSRIPPVHASSRPSAASGIGWIRPPREASPPDAVNQVLTADKGQVHPRTRGSHRHSGPSRGEGRASNTRRVRPAYEEDTLIVRTRRLGALILATGLAATACSGSATPSPSGGGGANASTTPSTGSGASAAASTGPLSGSINIDGSSTVYPITQAVAEEFQKANSGVKVTVAFAGTGGGFKKFCNGETDMNDASRPIKKDDAGEGQACTAKNIEYVELGIATDALSVVVNKDNTWATCLTTAQLKKIWDQGSTVTKWSDVDPSFPAEPIKLYGPGADSGTFDYFTEAINGKAKQSRSDYTQSEDDNALVTGVAGDKDALGYFGFAYLEENLDKIKAVQIDGGSGCVEPNAENVNAGTYKPLARPLFIYPSLTALQRPEFAAFVQYYLDNVNTYVDETGYIEAHPDVLAKSKSDLAAALAK